MAEIRENVSYLNENFHGKLNNSLRIDIAVIGQVLFRIRFINDDRSQ